MDRLSRHWPTARAGLILLHLLAITAMALPAPTGADDPASYEHPQSQQALERTASTLRRLGREVTARDVQDAAVAVSRQILRARRAALAPLEPYRACCGTRQGYRMFSGVNRFGDRLVVEVDRGAGWTALYRARDPELGWRRAVFDHELSRSMLSRYVEPKHRARWRALAEWIAREIGAEDPRVRRVRVSFERSAVASAAEDRAGHRPEAKRTRVHTLDLTELR